MNENKRETVEEKNKGRWGEGARGSEKGGNSD
jgi:hypothetical protein